MHLRARRLDNAGAACERGLLAQGPASVRGALLYNMGLIEEIGGDAHAACDWLKQSIVVRPDSAATLKKLETLGCNSK